MKKSLLLIALAGLMVLAACKKDKENQGVAQFTATMEHLDGRTSLDPNNGQINWTAGDQIVISNADDETAIFSLQSGEGTTEGSFGTSDEFNTVGPFLAAYPSDAVIADDKVTFNLPPTQTICETGTFGNGANPMVACSDDKNLQFKNLCGGLGIRLKGVGTHVSAVRITSKNTSEKLWGAYEVSNCAAAEPTLTIAANNQGTNVITLNCDVTLTTAAKTFFVMLPPGTLANGFTMEVLDGSEVLAAKETTSDIALVERNNMKCFNEILIDMEFDGNVEIPTGMSNTDIIVTNLGEDAIPDENGNYHIGDSKMLTAINSGNGKIIYISNLSVDYDDAKGIRQQNYELSAKETALHYALCLIPFGTYQSQDATFNSMKNVLYDLTCVRNLETAIQNSVNQHGYLKVDEIATELNAVWEYLKTDLLDRFFEEGKSVSPQQPTVVGKISLTKDGVEVSSIPNLPVSYYRGVRLDINENGTYFNPSSNTWTLAMTGYSDNGVYIGVNKGSIGNDGLAYPSNERIHYYLPPMNVGKFLGTFTSYSGIRAYFQDTWRLFFEEGFGFADMTWDMAKLDGITLELGRNDNAIMMMSPKDSEETAVINVVYASLQIVGFALDRVLDTQRIDAFFTSLLNDAEFVSSVTANFGGGLSNFASIAQDVLERLADFLVEQGISLLDGMDLDKALDYISDNAARAVLEMVGNDLGMIASWGLFDTFGFFVEAEYNNDLPSVSTESFEVLSSSQASVVAKLESIGTISVTEVGVCYSSTVIVPTVNDRCVSHLSPTMTGSYPCQLNDLQANTTYYARAYAKCPLDVVVYSSNVVSFNTGNQPTVTTHEMLSANIGDTWATVTGSVVFPDTNQPTEYERGFVLGESEYGLTVNSENMVLPYEGTALLNFSCTFTDLWPETAYFVRAYSYSPNGQVVYGEIVSFETLPDSTPQSFTITTTANPTDGGTVTGNGTYDQGQSCTVTATANSGYTFNNWTENGNAVSTNASYTFAVNADRTLVANFTANGGGGGGSGNHEYVDLGLPSGLLWATCNVGANAPEDYGDYFAWGETQTKDVYNWSTYQYCNGSQYTLTKYCTNFSYCYNGFFDNLATLLPVDDAATANWGSDWRMPTQAEFQELYNNTTVTWTTQNGVNGKLFTASNGNSLFLPAAGYRGSSSLDDAGSSGYYWSSSLRTDLPCYAWRLNFGSGDYLMSYGDYRCYGHSVRPVRSSGQN
jgi:hypothetical protein